MTSSGGVFSLDDVFWQKSGGKSFEMIFWSLFLHHRNIFVFLQSVKIYAVTVFILFNVCYCSSNLFRFLVINNTRVKFRVTFGKGFTFPLNSKFTAFSYLKKWWGRRGWWCGELPQRVQTVSFTLTLDEMGTRIDHFEKNVADLMTQVGMEEQAMSKWQQAHSPPNRQTLWVVTLGDPGAPLAGILVWWEAEHFMFAQRSSAGITDLTSVDL